MGRICLAVCHSCGYIGNRAFDDSRISYGARYEISLHHSPAYQSFLEKTATRLVDRHSIRNKTVLEIACGSAHFLQLVCRAGGNKGIGIDPSVPRVGTEPCGTRDLTLIRDLYAEKYAHLDADLVCCRQMFHSLPNPMEFLKMVRRIIGTRHNTTVYFEVPNAEYQYDGPIKWNFFFECASQFHTTSLSRTFARAGFLVRDCQPCYENNQYLYIDAVPDPAHSGDSDREYVVSENFLNKIATFSSRYSEAEATWRKQIQDLGRSGEKVVGWGGGGRAGVFLNIFDARTLIPFVVDINPNRQNGYLPGTGQKMVPPEFLLIYKPDVVLITNPTYVTEIKNQVKSMGLKCEFLSL
jgi:SAM-dependent methyltransferase